MLKGFSVKSLRTMEQVLQFIRSKENEERMKSNIAILIAGITLIVCGGILFYSLENIPNLDPALRGVKHWGTFAGLSGIGVVIAGILLTLTRRQQPIQENFEGL